MTDYFPTPSSASCSVYAYLLVVADQGRVMAGELLRNRCLEPSAISDSFAPLNHDRERFTALAKKWRAETSHLSVMDQRYAHRAYQEILAMGKKAVPFILDELDSRPDFWFQALALITQEHVSNRRDSFEVARQKWLAWGKARNSQTFDHGYFRLSFSEATAFS